MYSIYKNILHSFPGDFKIGSTRIDNATYSRTSMARTLMARLPRLFRTRS